MNITNKRTCHMSPNNNCIPTCSFHHVGLSMVVCKKRRASFNATKFFSMHKLILNVSMYVCVYVYVFIHLIICKSICLIYLVDYNYRTLLIGCKLVCITMILARVVRWLLSAIVIVIVIAQYTILLPHYVVLVKTLFNLGNS